jgi:hypothetical protein
VWGAITAPSQHAIEARTPRGVKRNGGTHQCDKKETMTSGQRKEPIEIKCERCGKPSLWTGGRRKRFCSPTCARGKRNGNQPRQPKEPGSYGQIHTRRSRQLKIERGKCADCNMVITEHNVVCIDWDHRNPSDKTFTISYMVGRVKWETIKAEIDKCDAVCRNCHALRTHHGQHWHNPRNPTKQHNRGQHPWQTAKQRLNTKPQDANS